MLVVLLLLLLMLVAVVALVGAVVAAAVALLAEDAQVDDACHSEHCNIQRPIWLTLQ